MQGVLTWYSSDGSMRREVTGLTDDDSTGIGLLHGTARSRRRCGAGREP